MKNYIKYHIFVICSLVFIYICQVSIKKPEDTKENKININIQKYPEAEITFADVKDSIKGEDRVQYFVRQDSLYKAYNDGIYGSKKFNSQKRDTLPIKNGEKYQLIKELISNTLKYPNSAFVVRPYDTSYQAGMYSLWTFKHLSVRNK